VLFRVTLPLLLPALGAAAGLAVALSMGGARRNGDGLPGDVEVPCR